MKLQLIEQITKWYGFAFAMLLHVYILGFFLLKRTKVIKHTLKSFTSVSIIALITTSILTFYFLKQKEDAQNAISKEIIKMIPTPNGVPLENVLNDLDGRYSIREIYDNLYKLKSEEIITIDSDVTCYCDLLKIGDRKQKIKMIWKNE